MATDLLEHVPAMKRALAVPGEFATLFPNTLDADLAAVMLDAAAEAQLDGFFANYTWDATGTDIDQDLSHAEIALIIIYAAHRVLLNEIRNRKNHRRYEAGTSVFEEDQTASMLNELLRESIARKKELRDTARQSGVASAFYMADLYAANFDTAYPFVVT